MMFWKMKVCISLFLFGLVLQVNAQCPQGNLLFTTQAEIDSFQILYPDCAEISSQVTFDGDDISNFNAFNLITTIIGDLEILNCDGISSIEGFDNLTEVVGNLDFINNANLQKIDGLDKLEKVGGGLRVWFNGALSITGLTNLKSVGGSLSILEQTLHTMNSFSALTQIGGIFINDSEIYDLGGLNNVQSILGDFKILSSRQISSLNAFSSLDTIVGSLNLKYNKDLINISGIADIPYQLLTEVEIFGNVKLSICHVTTICDFLADPITAPNAFILNNGDSCSSNSEVTSYCTGVFPDCPDGDVIFHNQNDIIGWLNVYPNCTVINGDLIFKNETPITGPAISDLSILSNLKKVNGNVEVEGINSLNDIDLSGLDTIHGNLEIAHVALQAQLNLLPELNYLGGDVLLNFVSHVEELTLFGQVQELNGSLKVIGCDHLEAIKGVETFENILGSLIIYDLPKLEKIPDFTNLHSIGSSLNLEFLEAVVNLEGLNSLSSVGENLRLYFCNQLQSISALSNVKSINGQLSAIGLFELESLDGLHNISPLTIQELLLITCPKLSICNQENICSYLASGGAHQISGNGLTCGSANDLLSHCLFDSDMDGFFSDVDCDDDNPDINPDAIDIPDNGIDENCDGDDLTNVIERSDAMIQIFPNPTNGQLKVILRSTDFELKELAVYNVLGQRVWQEKTDSNNLSPINLDLSALVSGVYHIVLSNERNQLLRRAVLKL